MHPKTLHCCRCLGAKKFFPLGLLLPNLQNVKEIGDKNCWEMEEIIATEGEVRWVNKAAVSANQAITASQNITVKHCLNLRRMPFSLPLLDNVQPSPPPSLRIME
ncbi:hypothetical protein Peur_037326 [Populus x canadensis]